MDAFLDTERLTLRQFTADDADLLTELDSDPAVMRYLTGEPTPPEHYRERGLRNILACYERWGGDFGLFAAQDKDHGAFVGWFLLCPEQEGPLDEVELGYRLRQAEWGRGYATEGSKALLAKAFTELGVRRVWADTMSLNDRSRKVMEKVGMTMTGTLDTPPDMRKAEGAEYGGVRYEITEQQWERLQ
ncbi:GNAT family N-acetyltransferase [Actinoplanes sp. NPDC049802]|uniref:GNAT family N-acetyltransferase n=1 Tax=Actinoplanes sp. NPDC049802 TaxID=3154742 RepID=UPI0033DC6375